MSEPASAYSGLVLPWLDRALALMDRDPGSPTHGCCDRAFWHYRSLTNFAGATWQQLMLPLALAWATPRPDNPRHGDPTLLAAATAALGFWASLGHGDGSFDEWYLNERSYCPTAFTAAGAGLTMLALGDALAPAVRDKALAALERAGAWLAPRANPTVMNQNLAAALAFAALAALAGRPAWREAGRERLALAAARQHAEGWLSEYGGADLGYSTLALDLLAGCDRLDPEGPAWAMARPLIGFLAGLVGPGPWLPGRLGSRGTAHAFAAGAEHFAPREPQAAALAGLWRAGHAQGLLAGPGQVDDRYFAYFHLPQFALAWAWAGPETPAAQPAQPAVLDLAGCGFSLRRGEHGSLFMSRRQGGALAWLMPDAPPLYDLGWQALAAGRGVFQSNHWREGALAAGEDLTAEAELAKASRGQPIAGARQAAFALFTSLLAASRPAEAFQALAKRRLIQPAALLGLRLVRRVELAEGRMIISDRLERLPGCPALTGLGPAQAIAMHSPSARQEPGGALDWGFFCPERAAAAFNQAGRLGLRRVYELGGGGPRLLAAEPAP
ncbi:MAG: hypothetical protein ACOZHQ_05005 [Thermodesulfobacteriota bacterium]